MREIVFVALLLAGCRLANAAPLNGTDTGGEPTSMADESRKTEPPSMMTDATTISEMTDTPTASTTTVAEMTNAPTVSKRTDVPAVSGVTDVSSTSMAPVTSASPMPDSAVTVSGTDGSSTLAASSQSTADGTDVPEKESVEMKSNQDLKIGETESSSDEISVDKSGVGDDVKEVSENPEIILNAVGEKSSPVVANDDLTKTTPTVDDPSTAVTKRDTASSDKNLVENKEEVEEFQMKYVPPLNPMMYIGSKAPQISKDPTKLMTNSYASTTTQSSIETTKAVTEVELTAEDKKVEVLNDISTVESEQASSTTESEPKGSSPNDSLLRTVLISEEADAALVEVEKAEPIKISEMSPITTLASEEASTIGIDQTEAKGVETESTNIPLKSSEISLMTTLKNMDIVTESITTEQSMVPLKIAELADVSVASMTTSETSVEDASVPSTSDAKEVTIELKLNTEGSSTEPSVATESVILTDENAMSSDEIAMKSESVLAGSSSTADVESITESTDSSTKSQMERFTVNDATTVDLKETSETPDEDLEFRAAKLPSNMTKVQQPDPALDEESTDYDIDIEHSETTLEEDTTSSQILTTLRELLLSLISTTPSPTTTSMQFSTEAETIEDATLTESLLSIDESELPMDEALPDTDVLAADPIKMAEDPMITPAEELKNAQSTTTTTMAEPTENLLNIPVKSASLQENDITSNEPDEDTTTSQGMSSEDASTDEPVKASSEESSSTDSDRSTEAPDEAVPMMNRYVSGNNSDTVAAVQFLHFHDKASSEQCYKLVNAHWNYATNLTEENKVKQLAQTLQYSLFHKEAWKNATSFAWKSFNDSFLRRWFKSLSVLGTAALPEDKLNEFNKLKAEMKNTYSTAKVCPYPGKISPNKMQLIKEKDCKLSLEPDLQRILTKSRDYDELVHVWKAWRDAAGKPIRRKYLHFVELSNEAARLNGFPDTGDMWREAYESDTFQEDLENLWDQLRPLYEHLHAYVRRRLIGQYGADRIKANGPIPAHLFGNMWAQSWVSLLDITQPFSGKPSVDVTSVMEAKNMSVLEMFRVSEEFFTSLGLKAMPEEFWKHSLIEKPKDREIICHASAWDFCNGRDYRIKQCTDITMEDLITVHHEMGHIQYFLQYARQPNVFREGANPGFHEAIGDVLALSVSTPKHLQSIGLLEEIADDPEGDLNFLLRTALDKVSFLPSGYLIDLWRWGLFSGEIKPEEMNTKWWDLRLKYQGICPPIKRTDSDFDPGAKYHVPGNVPYIRYFVSFVIQFQFHKVLCDAAGHTGPLYKCDIYRSKEAGQILSQVMELGSSEHWSEAMKIMTGGATNKMDASPILEYFEPLLQFLQEQNINETLGWISEDSTICP